MRPRRFILSGLAALAAFAVASAFPALTANNPVPVTWASQRTSSISADNLKPSSCASITLTAKVSGSGTINGGAASELITGSSGIDTIRGNGGNDCILGGAGIDSLRGDAGTDVCIGGAGIDTFHSTCETQIQ